MPIDGKRATQNPRVALIEKVIEKVGKSGGKTVIRELEIEGMRREGEI